MRGGGERIVSATTVSSILMKGAALRRHKTCQRLKQRKEGGAGAWRWRGRGRRGRRAAGGGGRRRGGTAVTGIEVTSAPVKGKRNANITALNPARNTWLQILSHSGEREMIREVCFVRNNDSGLGVRDGWRSEVSVPKKVATETGIPKCPGTIVFTFACASLCGRRRCRGGGAFRAAAGGREGEG